MDEPQVTLRDAIESAVEEHETAPAVEQDAAPAAEAPRDDAGRFAAPPQDEQPAPAPTKPRPSSWKKDYDEHWTKLDPSLQDYIAQREQEYAKGVSTYKQNWDQAAPLYEAMQPDVGRLLLHQEVLLHLQLQGRQGPLPPDVAEFLPPPRRQQR